MKKLTFLLLAFLMVGSAFGYTNRNYLSTDQSVEQIKPLLKMNQTWVKYPTYQDREGWDALLGSTKEGVIKAGEAYLDYAWRHINATEYLEFERSGSRNAMQTPNSRNSGALAALFLAELAEGKGRFIDQLINGVYFYCEQTSWVLSAHLFRQTAGGSLPDFQEHTIDLGSGGMGATLSWIYYYLAPEFDKVTPLVSPYLRHELQERILDTYLANTTFWWLATNYKEGDMVNNWNPWCNSNCLMAFMLLEDDPDVLAKAVYKSMVSVDKFINYTHEDGACEEGPSYWGHAAGKMYDYLEMLSQLTDGKISIFDTPMIKSMGEYIANSYVGNGWVVNFADASARGGGDAPLIYRYGKQVGSEQMMSYSKSIYKESNKVSGGDLFRAFETLTYAPEMRNYTTPYNPLDFAWYPQTEFCYMTNKKGMFFAAKGGYNAESHNHNDAGTFSLYMDNTPIFIDAGVGTYTRFTFSAQRYDIWTMQSNYHSLPLINGHAQVFGAEYKAQNSTFNSRRNTFSTNIAAAYPAEAGIESWVRSYTLSSRGLTINDKFALEGATQANQVNFMTWGKVDISTPGEILIEVKGVKAKLNYDKRTFTATLETIEQDDTRLSSVWGSEIYRITLHAKNITNQGSYKFTVTQEK